MKKQHQFNLWYIILAMLGVLFLHDIWDKAKQIERMPYSEFQQILEQGRLEEIHIDGDYIHGSLKQATDEGKTRFITTRVDPQLVKMLEGKDVIYAGVVQNRWLTQILSWMVPILLFFALWMFIIRRMAEKQGLGGFATIGKSKAKVFVEKDIKVTFDDVAGVDEAKEELQEIVSFLKNPADYGRLGGRPPKGVLLVGPPGTGKTLLARAVAGEAGVPFFSISGSEFVEMFVGVGAARVRDLFEQARSQAPSIIFIDELDALGKSRSISPMMGGHDEREQTLHQLLSELDGFDTTMGIVLLAATNRPEILDPALLRAGRFDRQLLVDRPDRKGRIQILHVHLRHLPLADDADPEKIAALTTGFSGADLANLANEATLLATRRGGDNVTMDDFNQAIERMVAGHERRSRVLNQQERTMVAYHESGHALVAMCLTGSDPVHKISIIPRGIGALGYTIQRPTEDRYLMTQNELENKVAVLLGGRAAEKIIFNHLSTGASDDLAKATNIIRSMITLYGMDERLGFVHYEDQNSSPFLGGNEPYSQGLRHYSESTALEIDKAVRQKMQLIFELTSHILHENRILLEQTAQKLLEEETLDEQDLELVRNQLKRPESTPQPVKMQHSPKTIVEK